jgi:hypothetical protein
MLESPGRGLPIVERLYDPVGIQQIQLKSMPVGWVRSRTPCLVDGSDHGIGIDIGPTAQCGGKVHAHDLDIWLIRNVVIFAHEAETLPVSFQQDGAMSRVVQERREICLLSYNDWSGIADHSRFLTIG